MRRKEPFIRVLAPAVAILGLTACPIGGKRDDSQTGTEQTDGEPDDTGTEESADTGGE